MLERADWEQWLSGTNEQADSLIQLPKAGLLVSGARNLADEARVPEDVLRRIKSLG